MFGWTAQVVAKEASWNQQAESTPLHKVIGNHSHCDDAGRMLAAILGTYRGREYYNDSGPKITKLLQAAA